LQGVSIATIAGCVHCRVCLPHHCRVCSLPPLQGVYPHHSPLHHSPLQGVFTALGCAFQALEEGYDGQLPKPNMYIKA